MVEILGVLAIIGVLSLMGIVGYKMAMTRFKANELLDHANKRAAIVAAQAMQGRETLSISEFGDNNTVLGFNENVEHDTANAQFTLEISGVVEAVCQQMNNAKGPVIRKFEPATCSGDNNTVKLTFNDDMSATEKASDYNTDTTGKACTDAGFNWCSGASIPSCQTDCCGTLTQCQESCNSTTGAITPALDGTECDYSAEGANDGTCQSGICEEKIEGKVCDTQDDCGGSNSDYYCKITASNCTTITSGACTALETPVSASISGLGNVIASPGTMNWWSAKNWCEAQGKHLINIEDFQVYRSGTTTKVVTNTAWSYGCASEKTCDYWYKNGMWKGTNGTDARTLTSTGETLQANYSPVLVALAKEFKAIKNYFWTASDYDNNSCYAFLVALKNGYVSYNDRWAITYALCE